MVQEAVQEKLCSEASGAKIEQEILVMRDRMGHIATENQMMVPLAYFHLINALTIGTVIIFSYAAAMAATDWKIFVVIWIGVAVGILGMREVAVQLAEPFGDDDTDLPVVDYVIHTMHFLTAFLKTASARPRKDQIFMEGSRWSSEMAYGSKKQVDTFRNARQASHIDAQNTVLTGVVDSVPAALAGEGGALPRGGAF